MAGRGGLNLTHSEPLDLFTKRYTALLRKWLSPYIQVSRPMHYAHGVRIGAGDLRERGGRIFPRSMKAAPLLRAWLRRLDALGVQFALRHHWQGWEDSALAFTDANQSTVLIKPDATLLALGGASWPRLGSGDWTHILAAQGVGIALLRPANGGFIVPWSEHFSARFAGQPLKPIAPDA